MEFSKYEEFVKFAIEREEEAIQAYGEMSEKTQNPGLKKLLLELQAEEKKHKKLLKEISPERIASLKIVDIVDLKISDYLVEEPLNAEMTFQDLLIYAAKKEQKAVELYSHLAQKTDNPEMKKIFEFMVEQERSHKLKLEKEYEEHVLEEE